MELFIEKEFLVDFYLDYNDSPIQQIVKNIISLYGDKKVFVNYNLDDFEELKIENEFFALICNTTVPIPVESIYESIQQSAFKQTLVFVNKEKQWFKEIEERGAWCFSFDNYQNKIKDLISNLHFKVDLSSKFQNWNAINFSKIPFNFIQITDGYILTKEKDFNENLIPLIKNFIGNKTSKSKIDILIKEVGVRLNNEVLKKEYIKKYHSKLNSIFSKLNVSFAIYVSNMLSEIDLHDRTLITNFSTLDSGVGFSLVNSKISNSQLISESIFEKYTYDRLKRLTKIQSKYIDKLNGSSFQSSKFYKYP
jgi:hypothetical protein